MASEQALKETSYVHTLSAKECAYKATGGEWIEPSENHPMAQLVRAYTFAITGKANLELKELRNLTLEFEISVGEGIVPDLSAANVQIRCQQGIASMVKNVQDQIKELKPFTKTWIKASFPTGIVPPGKTLDFSLEHTNPPTMLGSLTFYQVKVIETGF